MNLRQEILKEHTKQHAIKIAQWACQSPQDFKELVHCFLSDETRLAQLAAWSVSWAAHIKPVMLTPHVKELVSVLQKKNVHDAVIRNAVRVLQETELPEELHGEVMNACFQFLEQPSTPVGIKAFSLTTLFNLSKTYPEIKPELKLIIEERWEHETAAFHSRGRKILAALDNKNVRAL